VGRELDVILREKREFAPAQAIIVVARAALGNVRIARQPKQKVRHRVVSVLAVEIERAVLYRPSEIVGLQPAEIHAEFHKLAAPSHA